MTKRERLYHYPKHGVIPMIRSKNVKWELQETHKQCAMTIEDVREMKKQLDAAGIPERVFYPPSVPVREMVNKLKEEGFILPSFIYD